MPVPWGKEVERWWIQKVLYFEFKSIPITTNQVSIAEWLSEWKRPLYVAPIR